MRVTRVTSVAGSNVVNWHDFPYVVFSVFYRQDQANKMPRKKLPLEAGHIGKGDQNRNYETNFE